MFLGGALIAACLSLLNPALVSGYKGENNVNITALMNSMSIGYDKNVRPNYGGPPVNVGISMYILSVDELNDKNMDYTITAYLRQFWRDPRRAFDRSTYPSKIVAGSEFLSQSWKPDTFFVNSKSVQKHDVPSENTFIRVLYTGEVLWSSRITIKASCPMDLQYFPSDSQLCSLELESFGYTMSDIRYMWNDGELTSVQLSSDVSLPEFNVLGSRLRTIEASLSSGNYSRLLLDIAFRREPGHYIMQVYLPAGLLAILASFSFYISRKQIFTRIFLCTMCSIINIFLMVSINTSIAKISYYKAIDLYLIFCIVTTVICFLETILVCWMESDNVDDKTRCNMNGLARAIDVIFRIGSLLTFVVYFSVLEISREPNIENLVSPYH